MHDPTSVVKPTWPYSQSGQGTHAPPFPIVQIPHTTGRFGHWAPQPAKHLPDYQGGRGHMHRHSL